MAVISDMITAAAADGYLDENAEAYVCQNLVLLTLSRTRNERKHNGRYPESYKTDIFGRKISLTIRTFA